MIQKVMLSSGQIKKSRDIWDDKSTVFMKKGLFETDDTNICNSLKFKNTLLNKGYSIKLLKKIQLMCNKVIDLSNKIGITLEFDDLITIIIDSTKHIPHNYSLIEFTLSQKKKLLLSGKSRKFIDNIPDEKFKKQYKSQIEIIKIVIIASRLLITIQTSIPEYKRTAVGNKCIFNGFNGEEGINYIVCTLELLLTMEYFNSKKTKSDERKDIIKEKFNKYYNKFKNDKTIKGLFLKKQEYNNKKNKSLDIVKVKIKKQEKIKESELDKKIKSIELNEKIYTRMLYLIQTFIEKINTDINSGDVEMFGNSFYSTFKNINNKEINKLYNNWNFLNIGCYKYLYLDNNRNIAIDNNITLNNEEKYLIKEKRLYYIEDGEYSGEKRHYINIKNEKIDLKTSKIMSDIKKTEYSKEKYNKLNKKISELTKKKYINKSNFYINNEKILNEILDNIKSFDYEKEYTLLVNSISKILNKNNESFINKYLNFFKRLENIDNITKTNKTKYDKLEKCEKLSKDREINFNNILLLKQFYLQYYLINLEKIKNKAIKNIEIKYIESEQIKEKLQQISFIESTKLNELNIEKTSPMFKILDINYNYNFVKGINIDEDIWSCDYKNIKKFSKYNYSIIKSILLYIIINQIKEHFNKINQLNVKELKDTDIEYIQNEPINLYSLFFIKIIDLFEEKINKICVKDNEIENIDNIILHEMMKKKEFKRIELENSEYSIDYLKLRGNILDTDDNDNIDKKKNDLDKKDFLRNEAEKVLSKNKSMVSQSDINNYVEEKINSNNIDIELDNDNYSSLINPVNLDEIDPEAALDIIDEGGYGDFDINGTD